MFHQYEQAPYVLILINWHLGQLAPKLKTERSGTYNSLTSNYPWGS